jgi:uncharacterized protein YdeI (YjbR/CyaY-like superfamily)
MLITAPMSGGGSEERRGTRFVHQKEDVLGKKDPRVDAYIAKSAPFAQPILKKLRRIIHAACPGVAETMKWSCPFFEFHGILCGTPAFKAHCAFLIFHKSLRKTLEQAGVSTDALGSLRRITRTADLPSDAILKRYVATAARLLESGVKSPWGSTPKKGVKLAVPADLQAALKKNRKAAATFENLTPGRRKEYVVWINEAKRDETRTKRLATAVKWMAEGKSRNWQRER